MSEYKELSDDELEEKIDDLDNEISGLEDEIEDLNPETDEEELEELESEIEELKYEMKKYQIEQKAREMGMCDVIEDIDFRMLENYLEERREKVTQILAEVSL